MDRIVEVFRAHNISYFFYCGGNDSMDTADKIARLAAERGLDLQCAGIAKTIDNDVGGPLQADATFSICDHDPGYGSAARSTAINILEADQENRASWTSDPVLVIGVMGRAIGFIAASARLADPARAHIPLVIILPEAFRGQSPTETLDIITERVNDTLRGAGRCIVVVSEGVNVGDLAILRDEFGHEQFSASGRTAEQVIINHLNGLDRTDTAGRAKSRLAVRGIARSERPGTRQRRESLTVSPIDLHESYQVGAFAAESILRGESGFMSAIIRTPGNTYAVSYTRVPLSVVANTERTFPEQWLAANRTDVTDDFIRWAKPLLGGNLPVFARCHETYAPKRCQPYVPAAHRS